MSTTLSQKMFSYRQSENPEESDVHTADEVLCMFDKKEQEYSIAEIVRVLDTVTSDCQVIYKGLSNIYIQNSSDWYVRFGVEMDDLDIILKYITQAEVAMSIYDDENSVVDKVLAAPNIKVIAFEEIYYDEYLDDGLHVVLGRCYFSSVLDKLPSMYKLTILSDFNPRFFPEIIFKLHEWTKLKVLVIKNHQNLNKDVLESFRAITKMQGVELQFDSSE